MDEKTFECAKCGKIITHEDMGCQFPCLCKVCSEKLRQVMITWIKQKD